MKGIYENDTLQLAKFESLEKEILNKEHYSHFIKKLYLNSLNIFDKYANREIINPKIKVENTNLNKPIRSVFWMTISSSYLIIFVFIVALFLPINDGKHRKGSGLTGLIAGLILLSIIISIITLTSYLIPLIYDKPFINYILNALIHLGFTYLIYRLTKKD